MNAPNICPICGNKEGWILVDSTKKGVSGGKALAGGILFGPLGLAAGAIGKKKYLYLCNKCGFSHEYDDKAKRASFLEVKSEAETFTDSGAFSTWIGTIINASPLCPFCENPQNLKIKYYSSGYQFRCEHCQSIFLCKFTFGGKIKEDSVVILDCGEININNFKKGKCAANLLINDTSKIK